MVLLTTASSLSVADDTKTLKSLVTLPPPAYTPTDALALSSPASSSTRAAQTYIFVPSSPFTTSVVPLNGAPDAAPFARVTLSFDAFAPSLVRTILTSGAERGVILGEFEAGMASELSSVTVGGVAKRMDDVLDARGCSKYRPRFSWTFDSIGLSWTFDDNVGTCRAEPARASCCNRGTGPILAVLRGRSTGDTAQPVTTTALELAPDAQVAHVLPHVLLSALVVERSRLARFKGGRRDP